MSLVRLVFALVVLLIFPFSALADSIDYQAAGSLSAGTAEQFGSIRPGHVWEVVNQLIEIDNLTTGMIQHGVLGTIDVTSGTLFTCPTGLCFHGGSLDIDAVDNSSIFDSALGGGTISDVNGVVILTARMGERVATAILRDNRNEFSTQALVRTAAPVPEPASWLLLGSGLLGLGIFGKKRCFAK